MTDESVSHEVLAERIANVGERVTAGFAALDREQAQRDDARKAEARLLAEALTVAKTTEAEHFAHLNEAAKRAIEERAHFAQADVVDLQIRRLGERIDAALAAEGAARGERDRHVDEQIGLLAGQVGDLISQGAGTLGRRAAFAAAVGFALPAIGLVVALLAR